MSKPMLCFIALFSLYLLAGYLDTIWGVYP